MGSITQGSCRHLTSGRKSQNGTQKPITPNGKDLTTRPEQVGRHESQRTSKRKMEYLQQRNERKEK
jgi:hypothetical protein